MQGSQERFLEGDGQYSTEYESGTESREAVNARIEPYPGDLSKVSQWTTKMATRHSQSQFHERWFIIRIITEMRKLCELVIDFRMSIKQ